MQQIREFLNHDILPPFSSHKPAFYFPRHLATPSFETLFAIDFAANYGLELVIGEDTGGKYVTHNELKKALGKLPIVRGKNKHDEDIIQYDIVVDLTNSQGIPMSMVETRFGLSLPAFHSFLMSNWVSENLVTVDEAGWIDRTCRGDIVDQYKRTLAMACANVIMVEWFVPSEFAFVEEVVVPAYDFVTRRFGVCPIVVELLPPEADCQRNWNAYPTRVAHLIDSISHHSFEETMNGAAV